MSGQDDDRISATFAALADPHRRAIVARLAHGPATVGELAEPLPISGPAVSKHLKVLESAGLVRRGRDAQRRPCTLVGRPIQHVAEWAEQYRSFWADSFDRLDELLAETEPPAEDDR